MSNKNEKIITIKKCKSFNVQIWCGLRIGYFGHTFDIEKAKIICEDFVDSKKECVTITPTTYCYVKSNEPGFVVGFIRYPRFINSKKEIVKRALELAEKLMLGLKQNRVTITTPKESIMLENDGIQKTNKK